MTHADIYTRLSGTTGSAAAGQSIAAATIAAPVYSTNWIDLDAAGSLRTKRELRNLFANFWFTTTVAGATAVGGATLNLEIIQSLTTTPATNTLGAGSINSTSDVNDATEVITATAHGLANGMRVTVAAASGALPTGLAANTSYYIISATTNTFQLSLTPGGSAIDLTDAVGTTTLTWHHEVVGCLLMPIERLIANKTIVQVPIAPLPLNVPGLPVQRYLFARYTPNQSLSAGVAFCDLRSGAPTANFPINANNYVTP